MKFKSITRKAILIGCPGDGITSRFLGGVAKDLRNMKKFVMSTKGGSFKEDEVVTFMDPTVNILLANIQAVRADYVLVYFSGHGFTRFDKKRMVALRDGNIADVNLLNSSPRQLVIVDACRTQQQIPGLSGLSIESETGIDHYDGASTYDYFSELIALSPEGKLIVHATQHGKASIDNSSYGGLFTQSLLHVSNRMNADQVHAPCTVQQVLAHVPGVIKLNGGNQVPAIVYSTGNFKVPFALSMTKPEKGVIRQTSNEFKISDEAIVVTLLALVVACVVVASSN
ncbi:MAG: caspase family protein [Cyclobacteriaceae bacterium]